MKIDFKKQLLDSDLEPSFYDEKKKEKVMAHDVLRRHLFNKMKASESDVDKYFNWGMELKNGIVDLDKVGQEDLKKFIGDPDTFMPVMHKGQLKKIITDAQDKNKK